MMGDVANRVSHTVVTHLLTLDLYWLENVKGQNLRQQLGIAV